MKNSKEKELTPLSASRIKTFKSCSWKFYCNYVLKLPQVNNSGAQRGDICHELFENLGRERHEHYVQEILDAGLEKKNRVKAIERYISISALQKETLTKEDEDLCYDMIYNAASYDFFGTARSENGKDRPDQGFSEKSFDFVRRDKDGNALFRVRGYIDKLFFYSFNKSSIIRDFKTSKAYFEGDELTSNMQDYMYSMAVKEEFPEFENRQSEFLFLKFDLDENNIKDSNGVILMEPIENESMDKFEAMLASVQKEIEAFDSKSATKNLAKNQFGGKHPPKEAGFAGKLQCAPWCKFPGQRKKADNTVMWYCPYKFSYDYYELVDENGDYVASDFEENYEKLYKKMKEGYSIEHRLYKGCPAWRS